jgi:hypothetical protein
MPTDENKDADDIYKLNQSSDELLSQIQELHPNFLSPESHQQQSSVGTITTTPTATSTTAARTTETEVLVSKQTCQCSHRMTTP